MPDILIYIVLGLVAGTLSGLIGIGGGIILYTLLKLITRQKINHLVIALSLLFVVFFLVG